MNLRYLLQPGLLIIFLLASLLPAQNFNWEVVTDLNNPGDFFIDSDTLYAATSGGFLLYSLDQDSYRTRTAEDGLTDHNFTAITQSDKGLIILGTRNGVVSFYDRRNQTMSEDYSLQDNEIIAMTAVEDTLWIACKSLVAAYLYDHENGRFQFRDFFTNFEAAPGTFLDIRYFHNRIWVASNIGLFSAPGNFLHYNLKASQNWRLLTAQSGLPNSYVFSLAVFSDTLLVGTANGLSKIHQGQQIASSTSAGLKSNTVRHIRIAGSSVYVDNANEIYQLQGNSFTELISFQPDRLNAFNLSENGEIWGAVYGSGLKNYSTGFRKYFNGPVDNTLGEPLLDSGGRLWVVSGGFKDERARGFSVRLANGNWENYQYFGDWRSAASAQTIMEDPDGNIWIGAWNGGLTIVDPAFGFHHFNNFTTDGYVRVASPVREDTVTYSPPDSIRHLLSYTKNAPNLLVITDITMNRDRQSIWLSALAVESGKPLIHFSRSSFGSAAYNTANWETYAVDIINNTQLASLTTDIFDNIWIGTELDGAVLLQRDDTGGMKWDRINESKNLKNNKCLAVAGDQDGYVWLGTQGGLNAYFNGQLYDFREDYQPIGLRINAIFVDAENNKWFATDRGLSLLKASGSPWSPKSWTHFVPKTSELYGENIYHTNLPSEVIRGIFVDDKTGDVYCGTASGLAILRNNPFTTPLPRLDQVKAGPNPLMLNDEQNNLFYFRNLTANSQVKILTAAGRLVRILDQEDGSEILGSTGQWNGRNENGRLVSSGVYLYLVTDEEGHAATGKLLVIRK